ncbi:DEAD-box family helicase [Theileria orientalis]|uniref:DEAD-box family helicase n=1 Tax=Theileria orientalis TaxID=68886 RepID=A0A976MDW0_THEOR|nr:DEAD-box family helicase [Theileria orientalis]
MYRRFTSSLHKRINSSNFKCSPYFLNKNVNGNNVCDKNKQDGMESHLKSQISRHPSVVLHPVIQYSLISNRLLKNLNDIQESSYLSIVSGKDVTIHSPIGTGKTIAYLLPILNNVYHIHDMLERLMVKNDVKLSESEVKLRNLSIGRNSKLGHSVLPTAMSNHVQDLEDLESFGKNMFEMYKSGTTIDKLIDVLYLNEPRSLRLLNIPSVPMKTWKKRSKNSIYRKIMSNPLGSVRCSVILVPNKDLISQVLSYIDKIDVLGRVSIQTLTNVQYDSSSIKLVENNKGTADAESSKTELNPEEIDKDRLRDFFNGTGDNTIFYEDELKMVENVPIKQMDDREVETVAMNMGNRVNKVKIKCTERDNYGIDGIVPESVQYKKRPLITSDTIRWGCVDIVVTTVQSFAFEMINCSARGIYPVCVVFDEVDMLFENNANRSSIFEIISILRPRPPSYNPLVHLRKRSSKPPPPVQIINVGSTINFGGLQTCGSMIYDRFSTSKLVLSEHNHLISSDLHFEKADSDNKLSTLVKTIVNNPVKKTVVYCNSLNSCKVIYDTLRKHDWPVMSFHSRSALATRLAILKTFQDDEPRILVATDLITRGINLSIDHVINYDFPTSSSVFFHRIKSPSSRVTSIVTDDSELHTQIKHFSYKKKPINQILSRKRSLRKKLDRLKLKTKPRPTVPQSRLENRISDRDFFTSKLQIKNTVDGDVKYTRVPIKRRLSALFNNYS